MRRLFQNVVVAMALMGVGAVPVVLQGQPPSGDSGDVNDPPSRAARLGMIQGNVSFQPGGVEDWVPATLNRPISTGDRLWTDAGARAELHLGSAAFRLNGRTNFTFVNLTDTLAQVQVSSGTLSVRVHRMANQESLEIDTPQAAFTVLRPGEYRIDVSEQGDSTIATVRGGDAEATAGGQSFTLHPRDQVRVSEENGQPVFDRRTAPVADGFDNFCEDRDRREDRSPSARYVSRDVPGYADLDDNGAWRDEPGYGMVWAPRVAVGWAPYHYGHWAWIEPWGWTWVDDAPWGYAPFHYGRWAFVGPSWVWVPGPVIVNVRPVYAPALVAWVGGGNFGVSIGIGVGPAVGWFPLGPREVWVPPYRYSPTYINQVNVTNTVIVNRTVINNVTVNNVNNVTYVNRNVPGAVTAVPQGAMVAGRPVAVAAVRVPPSAAAQAQVASYAAVAPQRGAVVGGQSAIGVAPPPAVANRTIVARTAPPPPPAAFNQRQTLLQQNPGQPLNRAQVSQIQQTQPPPARQAFRPALPQRPFPQGGQSGLPQRSGQVVAPGQGQPPQVNPRPQFGQQTPGQQPVGQQPAGGQPAGGQRGNREVFGGGQPAGGQPQGNPPPFRRQPQVQQPVPQPPGQNTAPPPARQVQENAPPPRRPQVQENTPPPRRPQVQENAPPSRPQPQNPPPPRTFERQGGTPQGNPPPPRGGENRRDEKRDDKRDRRE
ncbi:MAG TPA: DUF6600 domain-containing protein [Bryobacteraceae bacterium]|nr:DUF6600 domain-containing protein [Bryobacteraceae bacterium]